MKHGLTARRFPLFAAAMLLTSAIHPAQTATEASQSAVPSRLVLEADGVTFDFVRIDPGRFTMGSPHSYVDEYNWTYEMPAHEVTIRRAYYMGVTEVTVEQFRLFVEETGYVSDAEKQGWAFSPADTGWHYEYLVDWRWPGYVQTDREPTVCLDWHDAQAFCRWLSEQTRRDIRLPSEAEWEYACRAGATGEHAGNLDAMGWYAWNSGSRTHPVAQKQPNAWGLYDMHGNAWEWCLDFFTLSYDGAPVDGRPRWNVDGPTDVVSRGGSFANPPGWLASGCRMGTPPSASHYNNGFRLVREIKSNDSVVNSASGLAPVETTLPGKVFEGTPKNFRAPRTKPVQREAGPPFLAPVGTKNVALGKAVSSSEAEPITGELEMITDGDKEAVDGSYVELGPLLQHVTIDLEDEHEIYGLRVWHFHKEPRVYFDVIVQISNDPDFITDVKTIFNNDMDNSAGLGVGTDMHYVDTHFGEIFDAKGLPGRYVRLYSRGNTTNDTNHYIEVEIYGKPLVELPEFVSLKIDYPRPMFISHRWDNFMDRIPNLEALQWESPPVFMVPTGVENVALGKPVTSSDDEPTIGRLDFITDGTKECEDLYVELAAGLQHVTIDLQDRYDIYAIALWHYHIRPRVYFDVVVQIGNDPKFETGVVTVFNNDHDNSSGLGAGSHKNYIDSFRGKVIAVDGVRGRYVRLYSNGNDEAEWNTYLEVEVYGKAVRQ